MQRNQIQTIKYQTPGHTTTNNLTPTNTTTNKPQTPQKSKTTTQQHIKHHQIANKQIPKPVAQTPNKQTIQTKQNTANIIII